MNPMAILNDENWTAGLLGPLLIFLSPTIKTVAEAGKYLDDIMVQFDDLNV